MSAPYIRYGGGVTRSIAVQLLLEEAGLPYELRPVDTRAGEHSRERDPRRGQVHRDPGRARGRLSAHVAVLRRPQPLIGAIAADESPSKSRAPHYVRARR